MKTGFAIATIGLMLALGHSPADAKNGGGGGASAFAPGHLKTQGGSARDFAPGQLQTTPGTAKNFAPGQRMRAARTVSRKKR